MKEFGMFCRGKKCPEYIEWSFEYGNCQSCKLVGESDLVRKYPDNCLHLEEIKEYEKLEPEDFKGDRA